jgi:hypothetical protein
VTVLNETLLACNQELETQLAEGSWEKAGKYLNQFSITNMPERYSGLTPYFFVAAFMEQLAALNIEPGDQDSAAKSLTTLKNELAEEKLTQEKAQTNFETFSRPI